MAPGGGSGPPGGTGAASGIKPKFNDGEKLLCYHGPLLYEAKCVKSRLQQQASTGANAAAAAGSGSSTAAGPAASAGAIFSYFIHYQGWNKNWDEWVTEARILKINPENLEKKEKLLSSHMNSLKDAKKKPDKGDKGSKDKSGGSSGGQSKKGGGSSASSASSVSAAAAAAAAAAAGIMGGVGGGGLQGGGGTDSASTSRASTPVSDRSVKVKRVQADDERSTSSGDDQTSGSRRGAKKARLSSAAAAAVAAAAAAAAESAGKDEDSDGGDRGAAAGTAATTVVSGSAAASAQDVKFTVVIPEELKYVMVSDWDLMTHKKKLFVLPAKTSVAAILSEYAAAAPTASAGAAVKKISPHVIGEVVQGICDFFDAFVAKFLLYKVERHQHATVIKQEASKRPSEIYGSAHLLRLMVKIGDLLDRFKMNRTTAAGFGFGSGSSSSSRGEIDQSRVIEACIADLLKYLETNRHKLFTSKNYEEASEEYLKGVD